MPLPLPPFVDVEAVGRVFRVPYQQRADQAVDWARSHRLRPAAEDGQRTALLLIDVQNTFCLPEFELFVAGPSGRGALDDCARIAAFLYGNLDRVTQVVATLDTHGTAQIFHPQFWVDRRGAHPAPHTVVTLADLDAGRWRVNPAVTAAAAPHPRFDLAGWTRHYLERLDFGDKFPLTIWPYHSMLGGIGHSLVSAVEEAVFFHGLARQSPPRLETKGRNPLTENYSVLRPEVGDDAAGTPVEPANEALIEHLLSFDQVIVAGQAKSHCVAWTVEDLLAELRQRDPRLARRVVLLDDCSSPVVVPGVVDWSEAAEQAYTRFAAAGARRRLSTEADAIWT
jgi:nicotinamidase-related amidase